MFLHAMRPSAIGGNTALISGNSHILVEIPLSFLYGGIAILV
jgi:hypothetical protein